MMLRYFGSAGSLSHRFIFRALLLLEAPLWIIFGLLRMVFLFAVCLVGAIGRAIAESWVYFYVKGISAYIAFKKGGLI